MDIDANELIQGEVYVDGDDRIVFARTSKSFTPSDADGYLELEKQPDQDNRS